MINTEHDKLVSLMNAIILLLLMLSYSYSSYYIWVILISSSNILFLLLLREVQMQTCCLVITIYWATKGNPEFVPSFLINQYYRKHFPFPLGNYNFYQKRNTLSAILSLRLFSSSNASSGNKYSDAKVNMFVDSSQFHSKFLALGHRCRKWVVWQHIRSKFIESCSTEST